MTTTVNRKISELRTAFIEDRLAKAQAAQKGIDATRPFTAERLAELCALGERMQFAEARLRTAVVEVDLLLQ